MGAKRLPRDPEQQRTWAGRLSAQVIVPPVCVFQGGQTFRAGWERIFRRSFELGAVAALNAILAELRRSDDPYAGLPPHLRKSAQAGRRGFERRQAQKVKPSARKRAA